jgi:flagellar basal body rod protein FlgF
MYQKKGTEGQWVSAFDNMTKIITRQGKLESEIKAHASKREWICVARWRIDALGAK